MAKPEIRLKGFEGEWKTNNLGRMGETYNGLSGKTKEDFGHGEASFITYLNVFSNPIAIPEGIDKVEIDKSQNEVRKGDILFTVSSETPDEVGMSSVWMEDTPNVYLNSFCFGYRLIYPLDLYFSAYLMRSSSVRNAFYILAQGISRFNISKKKAMDIEVGFPEKREQIKIGKYFQSLDSMIQTTTKKISSLKQLKSASLISMFPQAGETTPRVRFKGYEGDWKSEPLSAFSKKVIKKNQNLEYRITLTNSAEYGIINQLDFFDHDISNGDNIRGYYVVEKDDFVYNPRISTSAPVGPINRNMLGYAGVMSPLYYVFRVAGIDKDYLNIFFKTNLWHKFMKDNGNSGARFDRLSITDDVFVQMPILFPSDEKEQQCIASYFRSLDKQISLQEQRLEKLKQIKSACLDKMFV